jgi:hypothetical protein
LDAAQAGASGSGGAYLAAAESVQNLLSGGGGGGASVTPLTGVAGDLYGTGWNSAKGHGVVVVKLT